jgi:hypothetical protein
MVEQMIDLLRQPHVQKPKARIGDWLAGTGARDEEWRERGLETSRI